MKDADGECNFLICSLDDYKKGYFQICLECKEKISVPWRQWISLRKRKYIVMMKATVLVLIWTEISPLVSARDTQSSFRIARFPGPRYTRDLTVTYSLMLVETSDPGVFPALSEPETQTVHKHIKKIRNKILSAITIHSYGQDIYYPKVKGRRISDTQHTDI